MNDLQPAQVLTDDAPDDNQEEATPKEKSALQPTIPEVTDIQEAPVASVPQVYDDQLSSPQVSDNQADQQYDQEIKSDKIETKRKTFFMDLKANNMGRYIKISERSSGKRSTIIIPEENIQEFIEKVSGLFN